MPLNTCVYKNYTAYENVTKNSDTACVKSKYSRKNDLIKSICINQSLCCDTSDSDASIEELRKQHSERNISICGEHPVCYNPPRKSNSTAKQYQKENCISIRGNHSVCHNISDESNSLCKKHQEDFRENHILVCRKLSICCNVSKESNSLCKKYQEKDPRNNNISVCGSYSVCHNVSDESYSVCKKHEKEDPRNNSISVCGNYSVCGNVPEESNSSTKEGDCRGHNISICGNYSVCGNVSEESSSSSSEMNQCQQEICRNVTLFNSTCGNYSPCYNTSKELDPFVEELLKQPSRTGLADESHTYWEMMLHCERAAFPKGTSNLPLPSREGRFYWHLYSTAAKNEPFYQKNLNHALHVTLAKLARTQKRKKGISIWDHLIRLKTFDRVGRKNLLNHLKRLLSKQASLECICLEGLSLTPDEGVQLLLALYNSRKTMRYVYCWRTFEKMVSFSVDTEDRIGSRFYADKRIKKCDWFRAIGCFECLTTLSVNYAYIATPTGDLLVNLAKKLGRNWQWLQLLCLEEEILRKPDSQYGEVVLIPDDAWREANFFAPVLKIQYAIIGVPKYDVHKRFFTKSTRIHTFALSTSIDLRFRQPWYINCTIKTLYTWYSSSLVYLCLQLWHNRENLDNQLQKLFLNLPALQVFEFIGEIQALKTLCAMFCQIRSGNCNVRRVNMQLQEVVHNGMDKEKWVKSIRCLTICFKHDFERMGVKFDIDFYCC